jgi:hypothetical protein
MMFECQGTNFEFPFSEDKGYLGTNLTLRKRRHVVVACTAPCAIIMRRQLDSNSRWRGLHAWVPKMKFYLST